MDTNRMTTLLLAGSQIVLLLSMLPWTVSAAGSANPVAETVPVYPFQLAQQEFTSSKWPGENAAQPGNQGMPGPGSRPMMGQGMGPGGQGMMAPGMGPGSQGMMGPGMGPGSQGMMGPGMGPGSQGMMGNPVHGSPMAIFNAIGTLDLSDEQRGKYDAIGKALNERMQEITGRMNAENEKLRKLQEEQMRIGKTLNDLGGHMMQATINAANHAEELLTDEQRQSMIDQGRHIMMQPRSQPYAGSPGAKTE